MYSPGAPDTMFVYSVAALQVFILPGKYWPKWAEIACSQAQCHRPKSPPGPSRREIGTPCRTPNAGLSNGDKCEPDAPSTASIPRARRVGAVRPRSDHGDGGAVNGAPAVSTLVVPGKRAEAESERGLRFSGGEKSRSHCYMGKGTTVTTQCYPV